MPSVRTSSLSGEVVRHVDKYRAGDVCGFVLRASPRLIVEVIAAVRDEPRGLDEVLREHIG